MKRRLLFLLALLIIMNPVKVFAFEDGTTLDDNEGYSLTTDDKEEEESGSEESFNSNVIVYAEVFCGIIGIIMLVMASSTNNK